MPAGPPGGSSSRAGSADGANRGTSFGSSTQRQGAAPLRQGPSAAVANNAGQQFLQWHHSRSGHRSSRPPCSPSRPSCGSSGSVRSGAIQCWRSARELPHDSGPYRRPDSAPQLSRDSPGPLAARQRQRRGIRAHLPPADSGTAPSWCGHSHRSRAGLHGGAGLPRPPSSGTSE
jgi:hypothetical protein